MRKFVLLKEKGILHKVFIDEILYVESLKDYVFVVLESRKFIIHTTISSIPHKFPNFIQISRSHVINPEKMDRISPFGIYIGEKGFSIGEKFKDEFFKSIEKYRI